MFSLQSSLLLSSHHVLEAILKNLKGCADYFALFSFLGGTTNLDSPGGTTLASNYLLYTSHWKLTLIQRREFAASAGNEQSCTFLPSLSHL